jgi:N-acetylglucosamine-6-phosphate deacetylase
MSAAAFVGADLVTPAGTVGGQALLVRDGRIAGIAPREDVGVGWDLVELAGGVLLPGFVDVQVNGGGGVLFNDRPTADGALAIAAAHLRFGSTGVMPTLISDDPEKIDRAIDAVEEAISRGARNVLGVHIEGPYLNPGKRGIHDARKISSLDDAAVQRLMRPGLGKRMVTLAPELAPAGAIAELTRAGVLVCAGHSLATYEQARDALAEGVAGFTHLFNAMTQLGSREPGMVGAALEDRGSLCGLIVDGEHVHPATLRVALAARGAEGLMLVTDAMPTVGSAQASFQLGEIEIEAQGEVCRAPDGTLAGSNLSMAAAFRNAVSMLRVDLGEASRLASGNPARFLGLDVERGRLQPGLAADLVHLDGALQPRGVWLAGEPVI